MIPVQYKIIALILIAMSLFVFGEYDGISRCNARWTIEIAKQKASVAAVLQDETNKVLDRERSLDQQKTTIEVNNAQRIADLTKLRNAASRVLRDPAGCGKDAMPENHSTGSGINHPAEGRLSEPLTELLLDLSYEADLAANYAQTCHEFAISIKE